MKLANAIHVRVFSKEGENPETILAGLKELVPFEYESEKIVIYNQTAIGFNETKIKIFSITLEKDRHITTFLKFLFGKLNADQKQLLARQKETRLDKDLNFFIRIDKEKLLNDHSFWITDSGNCYHISISVAAYPKKTECALSVIDKILSI